MKIGDEQKKRVQYVVGGTIGLSLLALAGYQLVRGGAHLRPLTHTHYDLSPSRFFSQFFHSFGSIQTKVERIRNSAVENEKLHLENFNLRLSLSTSQFDCSAKGAKQTTQEFELKLSKETGAKVGRSLSSINYHAPPQLLPSQLYTLAIAYVVAREDEKAAVLLTLLTGEEGKMTYKTAKDFLMTGVAWYRIENYSLADSYFDEVLKIQESETSIQHQAQARLWKAIVAAKLEKRHKSQFWLKELVDHHPNAEESKWVNLTEGKHEAAK